MANFDFPIASIMELWFHLDGSGEDHPDYEWVCWLRDHIKDDLGKIVSGMGIDINKLRRKRGRRFLPVLLGDARPLIIKHITEGWSFKDGDCNINENNTRCFDHNCGIYNRCGKQDCPHCNPEGN